MVTAVEGLRCGGEGEGTVAVVSLGGGFPEGGPVMMSRHVRCGAVVELVLGGDGCG